MEKNKEIKLIEGQQLALQRLISFAESQDRRVFILRGYAGTGKTTLMRMFINYIKKAGYVSSESDEDSPIYHLLASTGRAAKILSNITGEEAVTVHSMIYQYKGFNNDVNKILEAREETGVNDSEQLLLVFGFARCNSIAKKSLYIIDEASMVSDEAEKNPTQAIFGTGRLLNDLLRYDENGQFIFVGDSCQLPPVNQNTSPALTADYFKKTFNMVAEQVELTQVMRQDAGNDIVVAAQRLRHLYIAPQPWTWAKFPLKGYKNIHLINSEAELLQQYINDIKEHGYNFSTLITQSNKKCNILASIIRPSLGINSPRLSVNDLLLVTQNNLVSGLMNGDLVKVLKIGETVIRQAGLTFLHVSVEELFTHKAYSQLMIADNIYSNAVNLSQEQQTELFIDFHIRMRNLFLKKMKAMGICKGTEMYKLEMAKWKEVVNSQMRTDPYLNALRCVYGYAVTCHKSQGGEWDNVYLDIPRALSMQPKPFVYQWVYTAMTRAKKELYVTNDFYII